MKTPVTAVVAAISLTATTATAEEIRLLCEMSDQHRVELGSWEPTNSGFTWRLSFDPARDSVTFSPNNLVLDHPQATRTLDVEITSAQVKFRLCGSNRNCPGPGLFEQAGEVEIDRENGLINYFRMEFISEQERPRFTSVHASGTCRPDETRNAF